MRLEELKVYQVAMEIGEEIYGVAMKWDYFDRKTIGGQVIRATLEKLVSKIDFCIALINGLIKSIGNSPDQ